MCVADRLAATASSFCLQGKKPYVNMQAEATGVHRDGPAAKPSYFLFNIGWSCVERCSLVAVCVDRPSDAAVLAELVLGIPKDAFPVVLMVVIALLVRYNVRRCYFQELFDLLAQWLLSDAVIFAQEMNNTWVSTWCATSMSLQAVGFLLPWWVEHGVPAMLTFMAADTEAKQAEHAN